MLTDIFARRYIDVPLWKHFNEDVRRLLVQAFRITSEQLYPRNDGNGKAYPDAQVIWGVLNKQLSMELGLNDLSRTVYGHKDPYNNWVTFHYTNMQICENFVCAKYDNSISPDQFVKERLSFIELAFRKKSEEISKARDHISATNHIEKRFYDLLARMSDQFSENCEELNERFRQAHAPLNYHNGFIQLSNDELLRNQVEVPCWNLVSAPLWANVDIDMKEAIDKRDGGQRDPAWHAARALESTIKIISDQKGWTKGAEKGAKQFLDNLGAKKNGRYVNEWEREILTKFFSSVRNPLGHGPGSDPMPELNKTQTDWAIEFCMSWIKNLIKRL